MAFGKRLRSEAGPVSPTRLRANVSVTSPNFLERAEALKQHVDRMLAEAGILAAAIKSGDLLERYGFGAVIDPEAKPISIVGFSRHFNFFIDGKLKHGVYAFQLAPDNFDPRGQLTFFELATAIMRLNAMCRSAQIEGALTIALQSVAARSDVDRIVVLTGYLSVMLEITIDGMRTQRKLLKADIAKQMLQGWKERAPRVMIEPATFDVHCPVVGWPVWLVEFEMEDHDGQLVVNNVYLPAELARPVRAAMVREQNKVTAAA